MVIENYDFELGKVFSEIKKTGAKTILIQMPDGLKIEATKVYEFLKGTDARIYIWAGSCFGFCDTPDVKGIDLIVQFGHNVFRKH